MSNTETPKPATTTVDTPQPAGGPQSYEDCIALIDGLQESTEPSAFKAAMSKIKTFLVNRMARRNAEKANDGAAAVKKAISATRSFKPYSPKEVPTTPSHGNPWA